MTKSPMVGIIGGSSVPPGTEDVAAEVGRLIAERGCMLVCGGLSGVMEAACRGARRAGGTTIGILPGPDVEDANPHVEVPIATGMGIGRNLLIVRTADVLIAIDGSFGTLSEMALAMNLGKPVVVLDGWRLERAGRVDPELLIHAESPVDAVEKAMAIIGK